MSRDPRAIAATIAGSAWLMAAASYVVSEALAATAFSPNYSYANNLISDLGVPACGAVFEGRPICSPLHGLVNAGFVLQGALFVIAALAMARALASPARDVFVACAALNGIGICLVGLVPETADHARLHTLGAALAIVFGNATALASASAFRRLGLPAVHRRASLVLPVIAAVALAALLAARHDAAKIVVPDGIWERTSVYTITAWELLTAACLAVRSPARRPKR